MTDLTASNDVSHHLLEKEVRPNLKKKGSKKNEKTH